MTIETDIDEEPPKTYSRDDAMTLVAVAAPFRWRSPARPRHPDADGRRASGVPSDPTSTAALDETRLALSAAFRSVLLAVAHGTDDQVTAAAAQLDAVIDDYQSQE